MIEVRNLFAGYGKKVVLEDINFSLEKGEFLIVLGRNGSGKTTLLKAITGFIKPFRGDVIISGRKLSTFSQTDVGKIFSFMGSEVNIHFPYTVFEMVLLGRIPYITGLWEKESDIRKAEFVIRKLGLEKIKDNIFYELSSGEKQKVVLAQLLCKDTPFILLDEPNIHLDVKETEFIFDVIKEEKESGKTVVAVLHDLNLSMELADKFLILKDKRAIYFGNDPGKEILKDAFDIDFDEFEFKKRKFLFPKKEGL
ncbi:MAG: iron ABC transporter ATP-binding protein [Caldiserica bacterium]|nr:MAG: iron ABC transporter ATP-binding protein [Caldisericota bacterium]